jgi:D-cysteine desulfhydrase
MLRTFVFNERLESVPRLGIGTFPTPLETRTVSPHSTVYIKRDDLCGHGRGGVKARKIDFFLRDFLDDGCNHLITLVTNVTNLAHDLDPLLSQRGIRGTFFVTDDPPLPAALRSELFAGLGAEVRLLGRARVSVTARIVLATAQSRLRGEHPRVALPSLGHPASVVGVARGFLEMAEQVKAKTGSWPGTVFITAASGVTLAGLTLGEHFLRTTQGARARIVGVPVYSGPIRLYARTLLRWTARWLGSKVSFDLSSVELTERTKTLDFGEFDSSLVELCDRVKADQDLDIDPIYGGKTWATMERMLSTGEVEGPCVYWHCGNTPDWRRFPTQNA